MVDQLDVSSLKVAQLKEELEQRGLETKGLKKDLAERLQSAIDQDNVASQEPDNQAESEHMLVDEAPSTDKNVETFTPAEPLRDSTPPPPSQSRSPSAPFAAQVTSPPQTSATGPPPVTPLQLIRDDHTGILTPPLPPPKRVYTSPLPPTLSHLVHPPTSIIYVSNLRRPLIASSLHELLAPTATLSIPSRAPFASSEAPGLWLSGVKDHAYASYANEDDAVAIAIAINGKKWPEDTGAELQVQFVDDDAVSDLIAREEAAWTSRRQRLTLQVVQADEGYKFDLIPVTGSSVGTAAPAIPRPPPPMPSARLPFAPPLHVRGPPFGGAMNRSSNGPLMGGRGPPPLGPRNGGPPNGPLGGWGNRERERNRDRGGPGPMRRTRARPVLSWREGPHATVQARR